MSYIKKQLGKNIKYYRNVRGLTQQLFNFNSDYNSKNDVKKEIELLIKNNPEKINDVYKILKGFWISII